MIDHVDLGKCAEKPKKTGNRSASCRKYRCWNVAYVTQSKATRDNLRCVTRSERSLIPFTTNSE